MNGHCVENICLKRINQFINLLPTEHCLKLMMDHYVKFTVVKCTYCKTTLNHNVLVYHETECVHQPFKCPDCSAILILKDIEKHYCKPIKGSGKGKGGSRRNEIQVPKIGKCTYCNTTLNDNVLVYHETECVHQPIKCPDCSATMILKDIDKHHCKPIKGSGKGREGSRRNEIQKSESDCNLLSPISEFFSNRKSNPIQQYSLEITQGKHNLPHVTAATEGVKTLVSETDLLSKHFKDLFTNETCWDTVVKVEDKEFKVHRAILSARSTVFSAMFQHDTTEKQTGIIKISDCDADSFKVFLEYLYTGKLENISCNSVIHLYTISDKYNVQELKTCCTKYLMQNMTVQNISEIVVLADEYDEESLFSALKDFFNKNFNEIVLTKEWENLLKCNYRLANKLLIEKSKADRNIK